jgi:DNA-binding NtrC family response regulator
VRALYVTGPNGGSRHVLLEGGLCVLGRGAEASVVIRDPRVSRSHAALHIEKQVMLTDLGSANGTFVGDTRLEAGEARALSLGATFFMGDSALVIRATPLRRTSPARVLSWAEVLRRESAESDPAGSMIAICRVVPARVTPAAILEPLLGELLRSPRDWLCLGGGQTWIGTHVAGQAELPHFERAVLKQLVDWGVHAEVESRLVSRRELEASGEGFASGVFDQTPLILRRGTIVVRDPVMEALTRSVARVAAAPVNVLILGETGVGKDVVASMLHELSPRAEQPFVGLNCASVPEALLESELFGHERGAFTGAAAAKPGLLEAADGGTVFLDEVGDLPLSLQAKLLRALESGEVTRLGALRARNVNVRFVAATNLDLANELSETTFRRDLYYRLSGVTLKVPALRERPSEIQPLAELFLDRACARFAVSRVAFSDAAREALSAYSWPGNVRELRNAVERGVLLAEGPLIEPEHLVLPSAGTIRVAAPPARNSGVRDADVSERERIERALDECAGNQSRAARLLGMPRRTLVRRIAQLGVARPRARELDASDKAGSE